MSRVTKNAQDVAELIASEKKPFESAEEKIEGFKVRQQRFESAAADLRNYVSLGVPYTWHFIVFTVPRRVRLSEERSQRCCVTVSIDPIISVCIFNYVCLVATTHHSSLHSFRLSRDSVLTSVGSKGLA